MEQTTIDELVVALSHTGSGAEDHPTDRRQLAIQLYHVHLPTLAAHGVVEFDPDTQAVRYEADEHTERVLDSLPDELSLARP